MRVVSDICDAPMELGSQRIEFIDVGSFIGNTVIRTALLKRAKNIPTKINSFEPGPIRKLQKANVQINGLENDISINTHAVSDADDPKLLTSDAGYHIAAVLDTISREFDFYSIVEAISLNTVLAEKEKTPDWQPEHTGILIKLDCNGFEPTVVKGARRIFENYNTIWVVEFLGFSLDLDAGNGHSYLSFLDDFIIVDIKPFTYTYHFEVLDRDGIAELAKKRSEVAGATDLILIPNSLPNAQETVTALAASISRANTGA